MCVWGGNKIEACPGGRHLQVCPGRGGGGRDIAVLNPGGGGGGGYVIHRDDGIAQQRLPALVIYVKTACNYIIPIFIVTLYCSSIQFSRSSRMCRALFVLTGHIYVWTKCNYT